MATAKKTAAKSEVAVVKPKSSALVSIKEQMAAELANLANKTAPAGGDKIQLKKDGFHLPDGTVIATDGSLDLVIVDFLTAHNYYPGKFDPKNIKPPVCFARGEIPTAMVPSDNSPELQSETCSGCPQNQFGPNNEAKACKNTRLLAVLPPDAEDGDPLWVLEVSPTALKGFDGFVKSVATKFQVPPIGVVVTVSLDQNVEYAKLQFGEVNPNANLETHWARREEARTRLLQEPDLSSYVPMTAPVSRKSAAGGVVRRK